MALGVGVAYQLPPLARGVPPEYGIVTGSLPPGINVSTSGAVTGAPTATGEFRFMVQLTDAIGQTGTVNWDINVGSSASSGVGLSASATSVTPGQSFTLSWNSYFTSACTASGGGADGNGWSGALPIFGTATQTASATGSFTYTVTCATGSAPVVAHTTVNVANPTPPPNNGSSGSPSSGGGGGSLGLEIAVLGLLSTLRGSRRLRGDCHHRLSIAIESTSNKSSAEKKYTVG
jgi:hypothetical protein